ncbi:hypothetical protein [Natronolimnobius baerhuensis]|uniref:Uncharacterized protein n=1 Tax=Natronolimnobius baerhuensis TaxID=253108 RepID=A0A202E6R0_9EURY|nr:hypothetical protein [Natronolimnobius baerhuensis]OVE83945.1 hypothetical protein B2G88_16170 [Natronolimnobius baerhuensis]
MDESDREHSRIADNRLAAAVVLGSLVVATVGVGLYWSGYTSLLVPADGPIADALPLYLLTVLVCFGLLIWGWQRFLSLLR